MSLILAYFDGFQFFCCALIAVGYGLIWVFKITHMLFVLISAQDILGNVTNGLRNYISAVYTGIKKPESFSHSGFSLKVARQLPLNTPKNPNRKTHLRSVIF